MTCFVDDLLVSEAQGGSSVVTQLTELGTSADLKFLYNFKKCYFVHLNGIDEAFSFIRSGQEIGYPYGEIGLEGTL